MNNIKCHLTNNEIIKEFDDYTKKVKVKIGEYKNTINNLTTENEKLKAKLNKYEEYFSVESKEIRIQVRVNAEIDDRIKLLKEHNSQLRKENKRLKQNNGKLIAKLVNKK